MELQAGIPLGYIFAETPEERASLAEALRPVAEKYKGVVNFATIDAKAFGAHAGNLNLPTDKFPSFAIQETVKNEKYPFEGSSLTEKKIGAFVKDFVDGKIEPSIKSEPIPEKQESPVTVVHRPGRFQGCPRRVLCSLVWSLQGVSYSSSASTASITDNS